ncbi:MAG: hypothetical protein ACP5KE_02780 [Candidatus Methanodesulfokora sp.]
MAILELYVSYDDLSSKIIEMMDEIKKAARRAGYTLAVRRIEQPGDDVIIRAALTGITTAPAVRIGENVILGRETVEFLMNLINKK